MCQSLKTQSKVTESNRESAEGSGIDLEKRTEQMPDEGGVRQALRLRDSEMISHDACVRAIKLVLTDYDHL